ncbi:hypothetical protein D3C77_567180 [compost metagenome]
MMSHSLEVLIEPPLDCCVRIRAAKLLRSLLYYFDNRKDGKRYAPVHRRIHAAVRVIPAYFYAYI